MNHSPFTSAARAFPPQVLGGLTQSHHQREAMQFAYLDASNLWLGAAHVSAVHRGLARSALDAARAGCLDRSLRVNFRAVRDFAVGAGAFNARTVFVGSVKTPADHRISAAATRASWLADMRVRSAFGPEKEVDTSLTVYMLEDLLPRQADAGTLEVTLFSGDRDLAPPVRSLARKGIAVDIAVWQHQLSRELASEARSVYFLDDHFDQLTFRALAS